MASFSRLEPWTSHAHDNDAAGNDFSKTKPVRLPPPVNFLRFLVSLAGAIPLVPTALFEKTFTRNAQLEVQVEELERELSVWKEAFKTADGDRKVLNKTVLRLERNIGALKVRPPLLYILLPVPTSEPTLRVRL